MPRKKQSGKGAGQGGNPQGSRSGGRVGSGGGGANRPGSGKAQVGTCFEWKNTGTCRFGSRCKFSHFGQGSKTVGKQNQPLKVQKPKDSTASFVQHLSALPDAKIGTELATRRGQWQTCWKQHASLDERTVSVLIEVLTRIPASSSADPPPLDACEQVFTRFLNDQGKATASDEPVLTAVKTVQYAMKRLLYFEWQASQDEVKKVLRNVIIIAEAKLRKIREDHRVVASSLLETLSDLERPWRIKIKSISMEEEPTSENELTPKDYSAWKTATVEWLGEPSFFAPVSCPPMKVGQRGVYDSPQEYMSTVHRLWIAMTFFDGFAAIAPRCRSKGQGSTTCSNALWPVASGKSTTGGLTCRRSGCSQPVVFACRIKSHDGICEHCAQRSIIEKLGPPGPRASSHIYDAKVRGAVRSNGVLYLEKFECRNPPPSPIHWRSTKRLSPPNLVGIVRASKRGCSLSAQDAILWGEVTFMGNNRDECQRRQNGELAVNMTSIVDFDPDSLFETTDVVVIDCMTFVPEWVPVLRALENQMSTRLPFEDGRYLNLWKVNPVATINSVLDAEVSAEKVFTSDRHNLIVQMVDDSQLEPIREVRRDEALKTQLIDQLENLVVETTLDKMQLIAFIDSLRNPVHLTQGPPGTGKSYLGVVIVRALIILRSLWLKKTKTVGTPPILVLSYKNHAIDEFLVDLVNAFPRHALSNKLIRIGGQCKDPRLAQYSEQNSYQRCTDVKAKEKIVEELDHLKDSINATMEGKAASFLSYRRMMFSAADDHTEEGATNRRNAAVEATTVLMESLGRWDLFGAIQESNPVNPMVPAETAKAYSFLNVDANSEANLILKSHVNNSPGGKFVPGLEVEAAHCGYPHWGDLLFNWICGRVLLPKCKYESCDQLSVSPELALCDNHRCRFFFPDETRCGTSRERGPQPYCVNHSCQAEDCISSRIPGAQRFCSSHVCRKCLSLGIKSKLAMDDPPRNVCEDHPMCIAPSCMAYSSTGEAYCMKHMRPEACSARNKKGQPCKGTSVSRNCPFCKDHLHLNRLAVIDDGGDFGPDDSDEDEAASKPAIVKKCLAMTRKGKQCKGIVMPRSKYCYDHSPPEAIALSRQPIPDKTNITGKDEKESDRREMECSTDGDGKVNTTLNPQEFAETLQGVATESDNDSSSVYSRVVGDNDEDMCVELEEDEADNLQHLREVFEVDDEHADFFNSVEKADVEESTRLPELEDEALSRSPNLPKEWSWAMSLEERWDACHSLIEKLHKRLGLAHSHTKAAMNFARKDLHSAQVRAKARVYENKSVIGGTMVGCIHRLDAIKTTRPFAVVVEEASEVLEPLLFSCLSESTVKLEMIGDHRQLQPSVQSRFDFEICNKINVSMFQRLIESPPGHTIPATVLSVQRRMRRNICDLTRRFYDDITKIEDHETVHLQKVGQRNLSTANLIASSTTAGREVPGIVPHVYLWTHSGEQKKSQVGVSRINPVEAEMCCSLVSFLVGCGAPRSSIAILTPYKGQLLLIRNMLLKDKKYSTLRLVSNQPGNGNECRLATVDRFQGDEEDIIIASLVVDEKSRTGFVKLVNRMIVLLSRARLGLYILGNVSYFEKDSGSMPGHWAETFKLLHSPTSNDSEGCQDTTVSASKALEMPRTGSELPICCPIHRSTFHLAKGATDLKLGFCAEICQHTLRCGHSCGLLCHWPHGNHSKDCKVELNSPCTQHVGKISCSHLFNHSQGGKDVPSALIAYKCPHNVPVVLPCSHKVELPCWRDQKITNGEEPRPECHQQSPVPYSFPLCGHMLPVTCSKLVEYTQNPTLARCEVNEEYHPDCGHVKIMKCWMRTDVESGAKDFLCKKLQQVGLPRCGHEHLLPCSVAQGLINWIGASVAEVGKVHEGVSYGPKDFTCQMQVSLLRKCGHQLQLPCNAAFSRLDKLGHCRELVKTRHPFCGHPSTVPCRYMSDIDENNIPLALTEIHEGAVLKMVSLTAGIPKCVSNVRLVRLCGHVQSTQCWRAQNPQLGCDEEIEVSSPLCGHSITGPCHLRSDLSKPVWTEKQFADLCFSRMLQEENRPACSLDRLNPEAEKTLLKCRDFTAVTLKCGHVKAFPCSSLIKLFRHGHEKCAETVTAQLRCGHTADVACHIAGSYTGGGSSIQCNEKMQQACWNQQSCGRDLVVPCGFTGLVACNDASTWTCPGKAHSYEIKQCTEGAPLACPGCMLQAVDDSLTEATPIDKRLVFEEYLEPLHSNCIEWLDPDPNPLFLRKEHNMLVSAREVIASIPLWERPILKIHRVFCYRVLQRPFEGLTTFDPQKLVQQKTLMGILTTRFTENSINWLISTMKGDDDEVNLLFGVSSVSRTMVPNIKAIPTKKKAMKSLLNAVQRGGYSSLAFADSNGCDQLLLWEPFPLAALCRLKLKKQNLIDLAHQLKDSQKHQFNEQKIQRATVPADLMVSVPPVTISSPEDLDELSHASESTNDHELDGTSLAGYTLCKAVSNSSGIMSNGAIPATIETDLEDKMKFCNANARPFAGLKLLRTLRHSGISTPILDLLFAAELDVNGEKTEAKVHFENYKLAICDPDLPAQLHPWALVIASRLEGDTQETKLLLRLFVSFLPTKKHLLTAAELDLVGGSSDDEEESLASSVPNKPFNQLIERWNALKEANQLDDKSRAMEKLLKMTGLKRVKQEALSLWETALKLQRMDRETREQNCCSANYCFLGNPGTGKTTVARLFAEILYDSGIREKSSFLETTAQKIKDAGTDEFRKIVANSMGGTIFIDEAYDLDPVGDFKGRPIVNEILTLCENERHNISLILAGYEDEFQERFYNYNTGLKSRFHEVLFEDFDEDELAKIWTDMRTSMCWGEGDNVCNVVVKRAAKLAGKKGFGNARDIRNRLQNATKAAMSRLGEDFDQHLMCLEISDVIGEDPRLANTKLLAVKSAIDEKVGWNRVKKAVDELLELCSTNYQRELLGKPTLPFVMNRMLLGNPGTGKTTFAKLYGRLLKELGFLSNGDVVSKTASDFVGSHVGESQKNTNLILESAKGKVLIIDEAYVLDDNMYGKQVLDTLVEKVQGSASDDIAVLLLGYEDPMLHMIKEQNPGLLRRFPTGHSFYFDDYNDNELLQILELNLNRQQVQATLGFKEKASDKMRLQRSQGNFGNAGTVEQLILGAIQKAAMRSTNIVLLDEDIENHGENRAGRNANPLSKFDKLFAVDGIKAKLERKQKTWAVAKREGSNAPALGHFVFQGPPGTGKTTVARILAEVLYDLELKTSNKLVEKSALDLTASYVGQTTSKVKDVLKEAKGGVLFIDEAYSLGEGSFGKEACDTLVQAMTSDEFADVLVVIAGYSSEINDMLNSNPGLKSRFTDFFDFPGWSSSDCVAFFKICLENDKFAAVHGVYDSVEEGCRVLASLDGWGNGRDVTKLWADAKSERAMRVHDRSEIERLILVGDVKNGIASMIQARIPGSTLFTDDAVDPMLELEKLYRMEAVKAKLVKMKKAWVVAKREAGDAPKLGHFVFRGSPGTGKTTVARVLADVLYRCKLKPSNKLVEKSALDLTADYVGQTTSKVKEVLREAKGGVLFIDEAYSLGEGQFGKEACDTVVQAMTSEEFADVTIIIAGYANEIDVMLNSNAGLKSRFKHFFDFPDWDGADSVQFVKLCASNDGFTISASILPSMEVCFAQLKELNGWGNGRDVRHVWDECKQQRAERVFESIHCDRMILPQDVNPVLEEMLHSRRPIAATEELTAFKLAEAVASPNSLISHCASTVMSSALGSPVGNLDEHQPGLEVECQAQQLLTARGNESHEDNPDSDKGEGDQFEQYDRDEGVSDEVWANLEVAKEMERHRVKEAEENRITFEKYAQEQQRREEEAKRRHDEELKCLQLELDRKKREEKVRRAWEAEQRRRKEVENELRKLKEETDRRQQEIQKEEELRRRLQEINPCPAGFKWYRQGGGWRCHGGSHYVTNEELERSFTS